MNERYGRKKRLQYPQCAYMDYGLRLLPTRNICYEAKKNIVRIKDWRRNMNDIILYPFLRRFIENEFVFLSSFFFASFRPRRYLKPQTLWYMYLIEGRFREISNFKIFRVRKIWNILNESDDDDGSGAKRTKSICCR